MEEQPVAKAYTAEEEQPPEEEGAAEEVSPAPVETIPPVKSTRETSIHVTWEHNRADSFDSSTLGNHYVYTPVIPEEYRVADGVSLPQDVYKRQVVFPAASDAVTWIVFFPGRAAISFGMV